MRRLAQSLDRRHSADARNEIEETIVEPSLQPHAAGALLRRPAFIAAGWIAAALLTLALLLTRALLATSVGSSGPVAPAPRWCGWS